MAKTQKVPRSGLKAVSAPKNHPYIVKIAAFVGGLDGAAFNVRRSHDHLVVVVTFHGKSHYQVVPATPSDWRGPNRAVSDIRHGLGLVGSTPLNTPPPRDDRPAPHRKWGKPPRPARPANTPWPKRDVDRPTQVEDKFHAPLQALLGRMLAEEAGPQPVQIAAAAVKGPVTTCEPAVSPSRAQARIRLRTPFLGKRRFFQTTES